MRKRIEATLRDWDAIPGHRTGTPDDARTADWLARAIEARRARASLETFRFVRATPRVATLRLPDGLSTIRGLPCFDAPDTPDGGISGRLVPFDQSGAIGVLGYEPAGAAAARLARARRHGTHRALVAVCDGPFAEGLAVVNAEDYGRVFGPPVLQIAAEHRERVFASAASSNPADLTITFQREDATATNVAATITGRDPDLAPLVIMTPRSGWWHCTSERGGGLVGWLESLGRLARGTPLRHVHFTATTGHELGHLGLADYLARRPTLVRNARCWIHLGANVAARDGTVILQASDQALLDLGTRALSDAGQPPDLTIAPGTAPFGEARNIFDGGGRYVSLLGRNPRFHHPDDRWPDAVDLDKTVRVTRAIIAMVEALANDR